METGKDAAIIKKQRKRDNQVHKNRLSEKLGIIISLINWQAIFYIE